MFYLLVSHYTDTHVFSLPLTLPLIINKLGKSSNSLEVRGVLLTVTSKDRPRIVNNHSLEMRMNPYVIGEDDT